MPYQSIDDVRGDERIDTRDLIDLVELIVDAEENGEKPTDEQRAFLDECDEIAGYCDDWQYGETLIRQDRFVDYAQELAEDIGAIPRDAQWPLYCIDWDRAAKELAYDYLLVSLLGHDYYVR